MSEISDQTENERDNGGKAGGRRRKMDHLDLIKYIKSSAPYALYITSRLMTKSHFTTVKWTGVHAAESFVLLELWQKQPLSQKELSQRVKVNHASIGQTLRRLEREELVERWRSPDDGRVMMVNTTAKGTKLRDAVLAATLQLSRELESILGKRDVEELKRILSVVASHFDAER